ncbi:hypothetical protein, partial [Mycobacterium paraintracellulare]
MNMMIGVMKTTYGVLQELAATTHSLNGSTHELRDVARDLRGSIAIFDDLLRPIRNYFYWEPHCYNIPICWS